MSGGRGKWLDGIGHAVAEERRKPRRERLSTAGVEQHAACLASYSNASGKPVWPSIATQARWQGVHSSTARRRKDRAVALGVVQSEARQLRPGRHDTNYYRLEFTPGSSADLRARRLRQVAEVKAERDRQARELRRFTTRIPPAEPAEPVERWRCGCGWEGRPPCPVDHQAHGPPAS